MITIEDRISLMFEQIEALPEALAKAIQQMHSHQPLRTSLPTLVENIDEKNGKGVQSNYSYTNNNGTEQSQKTYLHPNDAQANRPSWSASNLTSPATGGRQFLTPTVLRTSSVDT